jgi:hypothetical protein
MIFLLEFSELEEFKKINHIVLDTEETRELFSKINELGAQGELDTLDIQDESYEPYIYDSEHHILTKYIDQRYHMVFKCSETLINFLIQLNGIK